MRPVKIITDSCADLNVSQLQTYHIDYAHMMTVYEGRETVAKLEWSEEEVHALYNIMRAGNRITTAQVPVEEFQRIFGIYAEQGYDVVYIGCSSKQSGSVNTGFVVAKKIMEQYPDCQIFCIDSLNASMGIGMLAIEASRLAEAGKSAEEISDHILAVRKKVNQFVTVHSLDALRRAGRVKGSAAFFGNLMGVKPILISDAKGVQAAYKKVKGRQNSFREIVSMLKNAMGDTTGKTVYLTHADCAKEEVEGLVALIKQEMPQVEVEVGYIGPIIGASIGPDAVGIWGFGQEVTFEIGE